MRTSSLILLLIAVLTSSQARARNRAQYRVFWVDTFNTSLNSHNDVLDIINTIKSANCNAVFVQVRRRGDSWYLNSLEPTADRTQIEPGFDPLADLIEEAHAQKIEVHAFVIIGAIWNGNPLGQPPRPPENAEHVFNKHGFNQATGKIFEGRDNWLTRTLLPDDSVISFGGHRIGSDFWIDLGHPAAARHTLAVLMHLVRNYDIDGLHLDRIRYPELPISTKTPTAGSSIGYNETSVKRFQRRYGISVGSAPPAQNDPRWSKWRRDQVTNFVRSVYLNALAVKPRLIISAALIAFSSGPTSESDWSNAQCYWRVYQDWRAWMEEGILDYAVPMNYKRDHLLSQGAAFDSWIEWTKNHQYNRSAMIGAGAFINSIEGTLRQARRALAPSTRGNRTSGVAFFSFANSNDLVPANPHSIPTGQSTARRQIAELVSALTSGRSVDKTQDYEDMASNPTAVFAQTAPIPRAPWKSYPQVGHLMGIIKNKNGEVVDTGEVEITRVGDGTTPAKGRASISTATDGNGFYGGVDLAPGLYRLTLKPFGESVYTPDCAVTIVAGQVSTFDIVIDPANGSAHVNAISPALFAANKNGSGVAAAVLLRIQNDGTQIYEPIAQFDVVRNQYITQPVDLGSETEQVFLILFGTGVRFRSTLSDVQVKIGGMETEVLYAGESSGLIGVDQINARLPRSLIGRGNVDISLLVKGNAANTVQISIK
jgi:uncharacterized protein (TIGR03437 family)